MNNLSFDSNTALNYDIPNFLRTLKEIPPEQEIALDFSKTPKECKVKKHLTTILANLEGHNVVKLDLSGAELTDTEARQVADAIKSHPTIKTVVLSNNRIRDLGAQQLAKAMEANGNLEILLSDNNISSPGAVAYVKAAVATGKSVIDLSSNKLGDSGAKAVAEELGRKSNQVETLILKGNQIGDRGDKSLAANVPQHVRIFYRVERGSILHSCPGMSNAVTRFCAAPIDFMLSSVLAQQEPEGTIHLRTKS